jgi:hypothetical protein
MRRLDPDSNVTLSRHQHPAKQYAQSFSTDEGMQMDKSDEHRQKAYGPIIERLDPGSNVTVESDL